MLGNLAVYSETLKKTVLMQISAVAPPSQEIHQSIENLDENLKKIHESVKKKHWLLELCDTDKKNSSYTL
jgi:hypothetical protein